MIGDNSKWTKREVSGELDDVLERAGLEQSPRYLQPSYRIMKRGFDIVMGSIGLIVLFPVFFVVGLIIVLTDGFPVIFKQKRIGEGGREFYIYKFRSMRRNAEEILKNDPALMAEYKKNFKLENDPRLLKIGPFIRSSSIDELPQLMNVVRGEMSLVGPRPIVPAEIEKYGDDKDVYLSMKPGCAGVWQCSGRSDVDHDSRIELDKKYFREASIRMDIWVILKTLRSVVFREGAR